MTPITQDDTDPSDPITRAFSIFSEQDDSSIWGDTIFKAISVVETGFKSASRIFTPVSTERISFSIDLLTTKVRTTNGDYNYVFRSFDVIQKLIKPLTPFCLGGFMLFKTSTFLNLGGFDENAKVAEDYLLSKKVDSSKFKILNKTVFTSPRRFENKGVWYMVKLMIKVYTSTHRHHIS